MQQAQGDVFCHWALLGWSKPGLERSLRAPGKIKKHIRSNQDAIPMRFGHVSACPLIFFGPLWELIVLCWGCWLYVNCMPKASTLQKKLATTNIKNMLIIYIRKWKENEWSKKWIHIHFFSFHVCSLILLIHDVFCNHFAFFSSGVLSTVCMCVCVVCCVLCVMWGVLRVVYSVLRVASCVLCNVCCAVCVCVCVENCALCVVRCVLCELCHECRRQVLASSVSASFSLRNDKSLERAASTLWRSFLVTESCVWYCCNDLSFK